MSKKSSKLIFCAFPAHCRAPAEPTYDFYICLPQLFAAHSCFPQLPATPRSTAAQQQPLVLRGAAANCGKKLCAAKSCGENTGAARISNCGAAEKYAGVKGYQLVRENGNGVRREREGL